MLFCVNAWTPSPTCHQWTPTFWRVRQEIYHPHSAGQSAKYQTLFTGMLSTLAVYVCVHRHPWQTLNNSQCTALPTHMYLHVCILLCQEYPLKVIWTKYKWHSSRNVRCMLHSVPQWGWNYSTSPLTWACPSLHIQQTLWPLALVLSLPASWK